MVEKVRHSSINSLEELNELIDEQKVSSDSDSVSDEEIKDKFDEEPEPLDSSTSHYHKNYMFNFQRKVPSHNIYQYAIDDASSVSDSSE